MEVTQIVAVEELRDMRRQRALHVDQVDTDGLCAIQRDGLTGRPSRVCGIANGNEDRVHERLPLDESASGSGGEDAASLCASMRVSFLRASIFPAITTNAAPKSGAS